MAINSKTVVDLASVCPDSYEPIMRALAYLLLEHIQQKQPVKHTLEVMLQLAETREL